jgi:hypothetical protein
MRKFFLGGFAILAVTVFNVSLNVNKTDLSVTSTANREALTSEINYQSYCWNNCTSSIWFDCFLTFSDGHTEKCSSYTTRW